MPDSRDPSAKQFAPPEQVEVGEIWLYGVTISEVLHWEEAGDQVFRSTEFDVIAGAPTVDEAVVKFIENAEDLAHFFADLEESREATEAEVDSALLLYNRFIEAYKAAEERFRAHSRRQALSRLLGRRPDGRGGYHQSSLRKSSELQLA